MKIQAINLKREKVIVVRNSMEQRKSLSLMPRYEKSLYHESIELYQNKYDMLIYVLICQLFNNFAKVDCTFLI